MQSSFVLSLLVVAAAAFQQEQFIPWYIQHEDQPTDVPGPIVDLDYARYQGYYNSTFDVDVYRGIRYAAPPKRWQRPESPAINRTAIIQATQNPPRCPQANAAPLPPSLDFDSAIKGDEDCLFLNVFAPAGAKGLPVLVWIHGGGYGAGSASSFDFSYMDQTVGNGFVSVVIQYRLGAFGFLSSADVARHGVANAGLYDMHFALEWVQHYISRFGGDPNEVTISGESAGGGSVMMMAMANGGADGTSLWKRGIADSPYLPTQPNFDDGITTDYYLQFARRAGCLDDNAPINLIEGSIFRCLQDAGTYVLQNASAYTSYAAKFGQWAFIPVTDGTLIRDRPTSQLLNGKVNGERMITGNNANEGTYFVPQNITTEQELQDFILLNYPGAASHLPAIMDLYSIPNNITAKFETDGVNPPYATEVSGYAVGWQQAANNLYAETTFVCPAYWLADAYSGNGLGLGGRSAWRYQYSIPNAFHGKDLGPLLGNPADTDNQDEVFRRSFQQIWGRFIINGDPTLPESPVVGGDNVAAAGGQFWQPWGGLQGRGGGGGGGRGGSENKMLDLNVTNAAPYRANWTVVDGNSWEGGRAQRCALWASIGGDVAE
ncbi:lipase 2 [Diplogelasinospora grovesii]|uniref:Carboxylic ester hydrolase n=1 Tax=Diplogelasinospora grovesii TaxID=303347 RepID=A0AAN6RZD7_9PEZI|nr:lipase 2 [Diplogelasinospora grovesii]